MRDHCPDLITARHWNAEHPIHHRTTCSFELQTAAAIKGGDMVPHPLCPRNWNHDRWVVHPVAWLNVANILAAAHIAGVLASYPKLARIEVSLNGKACRAVTVIGIDFLFPY